MIIITGNAARIENMKNRKYLSENLMIGGHLEDLEIYGK
jgi:hypothetical protein